MMPFSPESLAKSLHATLEDAFKAIPPEHSHAFLFDAVTAPGFGVQAIYVQRAPKGWNIELAGAVDKKHGVSGRVALAKSW